ncbi:hypothetical protein Tco_0397184 [Tanacetum coccineum]
MNQAVVIFDDDDDVLHVQELVAKGCGFWHNSTVSKGHITKKLDEPRHELRTNDDEYESRKEQRRGKELLMQLVRWPFLKEFVKRETMKIICIAHLMSNYEAYCEDKLKGAHSEAETMIFEEY